MASPDALSGPTSLYGPGQNQGLSVMANGNDIVIANNGAIVSVGDNTAIRGNTGDAAASGSIAIDVEGSSVTSGNSTGNSSGNSGLAPPLYGQPANGSRNPNWLQSPDVQRLSSALTGQMPPTAAGYLTSNAPAFGALPGGSPGAPTGRAVGLAGYELHSIDVAGNDNLVTYDDSNLSFHRSGTLNGNTGDTDTSGLNVVDSLRSVVRSGDSGDSDETPDPPPFNPASLGSSVPSGLLSAGAMGGASVSVADINGVSTASGQDTLVVGGDGLDDNGVRVRGDRNVATYDDGNVAVGGVGDVNAQIGDSDTSGAVVMAVRDSNIASGDSFLPASQQAGAQVGDPFDGNDPDVGPPDAPTPRLSAPPAPLGTPSTGAT
jgi:hypothetical protein